MGRPTKYKPAMLSVIEELMRDGASLAEVCAEIDISAETCNQWRKEDGPYYIEAFSETIKEGTHKSQGWWEKKARLSAIGEQECNPTMMIFNLKNRFREDWRDAQDRNHTGTIGLEAYELSETERSARIAALLDAAGSRRDEQADNGECSEVDAT